jgi:CRP-like cAMP-binding protein
MPNAADVLSSVPLFAAVSKKDLARLAREAHERTFPAGTVLTDQDEFGTIFTVIVDGKAVVSVEGEPVARLGSGGYFGEMALIDRDRRSATVVAETDLSCVMLTQWVFRPFAMEHPEVSWALLEVMVARVREAERRHR